LFDPLLTCQSQIQLDLHFKKNSCHCRFVAADDVYADLGMADDEKGGCSVTE